MDHSRLIDAYRRDGVLRWIEHGIDGGSFLMAVFSNDLKEAFGRADDINAARLRDYIVYLYNYAPTGCWGSPDNVKAWRKAGGLEGINAQYGGDAA